MNPSNQKPHPKPNVARYLGLLPLVLAPVALAACSSAHADPSDDVEEFALERVEVHTASVRREPVASTYLATGSVRARNTATLTARAMAYVRTLEVEPGARVRQGDLLATLDDADSRAGLQQAQAMSSEAEAALAQTEQQALAADRALALAATTWERMRAMRADESISQQRADEAETAYQVAQAQAAAVRSGLARARSRIAQSQAGVRAAVAGLEHFRVRAPFDGIVIARPAQLGDLASPAMPLFVVAQEGALRVELTVPESLAGSLAIGAALPVHVAAIGARLEGTVAEISPQVDAAARAVLVKLDLPEEAGALQSGMFARVAVPRAAADALTVPAEAVSSRGSLDRVFVISEGRARLRLVTRGAVYGDRVIVLSGLEEGEEVVLAPSTTLRDRDSVEVVR
jgi:RND family efflux transporter MFP subunit